MTDELTEWFETADAVIVSAREAVVVLDTFANDPDTFFPEQVREAIDKMREALEALDARDAEEEEPNDDDDDDDDDYPWDDAE